jgi:hypothetical protein
MVGNYCWLLGVCFENRRAVPAVVRTQMITYKQTYEAPDKRTKSERRGEEELSFVINHNFLCLSGVWGGDVVGGEQ